MTKINSNGEKENSESKSTKTLKIDENRDHAMNSSSTSTSSSFEESSEHGESGGGGISSSSSLISFLWKESYWSGVASLSFLCTGLVRAYTSPALLSINSEIFSANRSGIIDSNSNSSNSFLLSFATSSSSTRNDLISWVASIAPLASFLGTILSGPCLFWMGRRQTLFILSIPATIGWLLVGSASSISTLLLGRALTGLACGLATATAPLYITEVCQSKESKSKRGRRWLGLLPGILLATGILLGFILAHQFQQWQKLAQVISLFPILLCILSWTIPESPLWLEERKSTEKFDLEMDEVIPPPPQSRQVESNSSLSENTGLIPKSNTNSFPRLIFSISLLMILQQFSGGNVLIYYLSEILMKNQNHPGKETSLSPEPEIIHQASLIIGLVQFIGFLLALPLIDSRHVGQRNLLIASSTLMSLAHLTLGFHFHQHLNHQTSVIANVNLTSQNHTLPYSNEDNDSWTFSMIIRVASLSALFCCYSIGMGPIPFLFIQLFSDHHNIPAGEKENDEHKKAVGNRKNGNKARSYVSSIASLVNHIALFAVVKIFPYLFHKENGPFLTFSIFAGVCWAAAIFTFYFVPAAIPSES